MNTQSIFKYT